jgi:hypothetical protein
MNPSREELAYGYSQLTDEALLARLHGGTLTALAREVVREELERRGVEGIPAESGLTAPPDDSTDDLTRRGFVLRRMTIIFFILLVTANALGAFICYRMIHARHPAMSDNDLDVLAGTLAYALIAASILSYIASMVLGLMVRARWTWRLVCLSYLALYLGALVLTLPAALEDIAPYF